MNKYYASLLALFLLASCGDNSTTTETTTTPDASTTVAAATPKSSATAGVPTTIKGIVKGLKEGQKIFFDRKTIDATDVKGTTLLDVDGNFELEIGIDAPGIYRVRLGAKPVYMLLKGGENVTVSAELEGYKILDYTVEGSLHPEDMKNWGSNPEKSEIVAHLKDDANNKPLLNLYLVEKLDLAAHLPLYKKVQEQLHTAYPNAIYTRQFTSKIASMEAKIKAQPVAVGAEAPEINLPNPDGKKIALSSLKGKVVLLDFWASWCRPCRMTNPHVVELYNKYNKKGFDVFNVSLDGLDDRRAAQFKSNPDQMAQMMELEKAKWKQAIKDDKLVWKNHVSELRSWSSPIALRYGVTSIPKTFVLDRNGVIRYQNLRGQALEDAIKTLLAE